MSDKPIIEVDMWDQEAGTPGTVSFAVRQLTMQWGLPIMGCGHDFGQCVKRDGQLICSRCEPAASVARNGADGRGTDGGPR